eukprot:Amastigsp_a7869_21.p1 type:complete len:399 gc:universal Amastigsp_a7869_21:81-1277(+)
MTSDRLVFALYLASAAVQLAFAVVLGAFGVRSKVPIQRKLLFISGLANALSALAGLSQAGIESRVASTIVRYAAYLLTTPWLLTQLFLLVDAPTDTTCVAFVLQALTILSGLGGALLRSSVVVSIAMFNMGIVFFCAHLTLLKCAYDSFGASLETRFHARAMVTGREGFRGRVVRLNSRVATTRNFIFATIGAWFVYPVWWWAERFDVTARSGDALFSLLFEFFAKGILGMILWFWFFRAVAATSRDSSATTMAEFYLLIELSLSDEEQPGSAPRRRRTSKSRVHPQVSTGPVVRVESPRSPFELDEEDIVLPHDKPSANTNSGPPLPFIGPSPYALNGTAAGRALDPPPVRTRVEEQEHLDSSPSNGGPITQVRRRGQAVASSSTSTSDLSSACRDR